MLRLLPRSYNVVLILLILISFQVVPTSAQVHSLVEPAYDAPTCEAQMAPDRAGYINRIVRIEELFMRSTWLALKYSEIVYGPLWEARIMRDDQYSVERARKGDMLYFRYEQMAESYKTENSGLRGEFENEFIRFKEAIPKLDNYCPAWAFQDCFNQWQTEFEEMARDLDLYLRRFISEQIAFEKKVELTLIETPSEHHEFSFRYKDHYTLLNTKIYPQFLALIRKLQVHLEGEWAGNRCCVLCTPERYVYAESALSKVLVPDPEGSLGVKGNVVGQANLVKAVDQYIADIEESHPVQEGVRRPTNITSDDGDVEIVRESDLVDV